MKKFTKEQMDQIQQQVNQIMDRLAEGQSAREICAQMYAEGLEDKTLAQGELMADAVLESISGFDRDYARAKEDLDGFVDAFIEESCKGKSLAERCTYLMKLTAAISGAKAVLDAQTEEAREKARSMVSEAETAEIPEGEATEELEGKLRAQLKNALKGSNILVNALEAQQDALREIEDENAAATLLVDAGSRDIDFRAIMAMQAYINLKNGYYEDIPEDMTAAQVATMVCTYTEEMRILHQVEENHLGEDIAHGILSVLGIVAMTRMSFYAIGGAVLAFESGTFGWILCIPAMMVVCTMFYHAFGRAIDIWFQASRTIVHVTTVAVSAICRGAGRVLDFALTHAKSAITWLAGKAYNGIRRLLDILRGTSAGATVPVMAALPTALEEVVDEGCEETLEEEIPEEELKIH